MLSNSDEDRIIKQFNDRMSKTMTDRCKGQIIVSTPNEETEAYKEFLHSLNQPYLNTALDKKEALGEIINVRHKTSQ